MFSFQNAWPMQAVRSVVASGGKFYRLPPDEENTDTAVWLYILYLYYTHMC